MPDSNEVGTEVVTVDAKEVIDHDELHVVRVLNSRELVIGGAGINDVAVNQVFRVLSKPDDVTDPVTGEDLGPFVTTKAVVRVYQRAPRFALARTFRSKRVRVGGGAFGDTMNVFAPSKFETRTETLVRDRSYDVEGELAVEPGDPVEPWDGNSGDVPTVTVWE